MPSVMMNVRWFIKYNNDVYETKKYLINIDWLVIKTFLIESALKNIHNR